MAKGKDKGRSNEKKKPQKSIKESQKRKKPLKIISVCPQKACFVIPAIFCAGISFV